MLECKTCEHNADIDRENCEKCLDELDDTKKDESRYLTEENRDSDVCFSCWNLFKEVKWACTDCLFDSLKK